VERLEADALAIVEECLAIPDDAGRDDYVRRMTDGKPRLRARVGELLSHTSDSFRMLATEAFSAPGLAPLSLPERAGPFRITGLIAEGGMGSVAKAERDDGVYAQTVAIKLIRGDISAAEARERFNAERRILARLDHPAIARVIDGGSEGGRPWLAMEYVDGRPVTEALDAAGAGEAARLAAFLSVCEAVAFAHRNFVVHADLKPGNVLMRGDGAIKLVDFGIARLTVELASEEGGAAMRHPLTPGYAAPEREGGAAPTVASDVYSLGVLLREMLGGTPQGDLAAIAARATAAQPADRYQDVAALAADVRAHLGHFPVAARANAGWRYFAGRFLRRHRLGVILTGAAMAALALAAVVATVLYVRAERARTEAEQRFAEVRSLSRYMLFDLYDDLADAPGTVASRVRLTEMARGYLERLQRVPDAPDDLKLDIVRGWRRLAAVEGLSGVASLGRRDRALDSLGRAEAGAGAILAEAPAHAGAIEELGWIALGRWTIAPEGGQSQGLVRLARGHFERALRLEPGRPGARLGLITVRKNEGYDLIWANRAAAAVPLLRQALADLRRERFDGHWAREARMLETNLLGRLGDAVYYAGDIPGALPWYREQDAIVRAELARQPSAAWTDRLGEAKFNLSGTLMDMGRREEALAEVRTGVAAVERVAAFGADSTLQIRLAILYGQEAIVLEGLDRIAEAVAVSDRNVALRRARLTQAPADPQRRRDLAVTLPSHATLLDKAGRRADACAASRLAVEQWRWLRARNMLGERDGAVDAPRADASVRTYCG
jgi:serine/threonine-protein kinase